MHLYNNEILCHCGKKGCLETEASGRALYRIVKERIKAGESSSLTQTKGNDFTLEDIIDAVNAEDPLCIDVVERIGYAIGETVANLINVFNPELVVIGGILARTGIFLQQAVNASVRKYTLNLSTRTPAYACQNSTNAEHNRSMPAGTKNSAGIKSRRKMPPTIISK